VRVFVSSIVTLREIKISPEMLIWKGFGFPDPLHH